MGFNSGFEGLNFQVIFYFKTYVCICLSQYIITVVLFFRMSFSINSFCILTHVLILRHAKIISYWQKVVFKTNVGCLVYEKRSDVEKFFLQKLSLHFSFRYKKVLQEIVVIN